MAAGAPGRQHDGKRLRHRVVEVPSYSVAPSVGTNRGFLRRCTSGRLRVKLSSIPAVTAKASMDEPPAEMNGKVIPLGAPARH